MCTLLKKFCQKIIPIFAFMPLPDFNSRIAFFVSVFGSASDELWTSTIKPSFQANSMSARSLFLNYL
jgi:hypothetical protein